MKYFLDTEFLDDGKAIGLISLGLVCEDGAAFYEENTDFKLSDGTDWLVRNVYPHLANAKWVAGKYIWVASNGITRIRAKLNDFLIGDDNIEIYGWYSAYDWVAFCQVYGRMLDLPDNFPSFCYDVQQMSASLGNPKIPKPTGIQHHALSDAYWVKSAYKFLVENTIKTPEYRNNEDTGTTP